MTPLELSITGNNEGLKKAVDESEKALDEFSQNVRKRAKEIDNLFEGVSGVDKVKEALDALNSLAGEPSAAFSALTQNLKEAEMSLKFVEQVLKTVEEDFKNGVISEELYNEKVSALSVIYDDISQSITETQGALEREIKSTDAAADAITTLRNRLSLLVMEYQKLSEEDRAGEKGQKIIGEMTFMIDQMKEQLGDAFSAVKDNVQALVDNLPALIQSPEQLIEKMPHILDALRKAKGEYKEMQGEAANAEPLWKVLIAGALDYKTAIIAVASAIYANRKEIRDWFLLLSTGHRAVMKLPEAMEKVTESFKAQDSGAAKSIIQLKTMQMEWKKLSNNDEREAWAKKNASAFQQMGVSIRHAADAENLFSDPTHVQALIDSMVARAKATAALNVAIKEYENILSDRVEGENKIGGSEQDLNKYRKLEEDAKQRVAKALEQYKESGKAKWAERVLIAARTELHDYQTKIAEITGEMQKKTDKLNEELNDAYKAKVAPFMKMYSDFMKDTKNALTDNGLTPESDYDIDKLTADEANARMEYVRRKIQLEKNLTEIQKRNTVNLRQQIVNAETEAMEEGNAKTLKQMDDNYNAQHETLMRQKEDYVKSVVEAQRAIFEAEESEKRRRNETYVMQTFDEEAAKKKVNTTDFDKMDEANQKVYLQQKKRFYENLQQQYETYAQAVARVNKEYDDDVKAMRDKNGNLLAGFTEENIKMANEARTKALNQLEQQFSKTYKSIFRDIDTMSKASIQSAIEAANKWLAAADQSADPDQYKVMMERVKELRKAYADFDISGIAQSWGELSEMNRQLELEYETLWNIVDKDSKAYKEQEEAVTRLAAAFEKSKKAMLSMASIDAFAQIGDAISNIGATLNDSKLADAGKNIANVAGAFQTAFQKALSGDTMGAIASVATSVFSNIVNGITEAIAATEKAKQTTFEYERALQSIADSDVLEKLSNAFGTNAYGTFQQQIAQMEDAKGKLAALSEEFAKVKTNYMDMLTGGNIKGDDVYGKMFSDMRGGFQKAFGSQKNIFELDLNDYFKADGTLDGKALKEWFDAYGDGLTTDNKRLVQSLIDEWQRYEDGMAGIASYISDLFGGVADSIADQMVNAFLETGDAVADLSDEIDKYALNVAKSIIQSELMKKYFTADLQDQMTALINQGKVTEAVALLKGQMDAANEDVGVWATDLLNGIKEAVGGNLGGDNGGASAAKGIAQASQDSVDELNGRFLAVQTHTFQINENVKALLANGYVMATALNQIAEHTSNLSIMTEYIKRIESATDRMSRKGIELL